MQVERAHVFWFKILWFPDFHQNTEYTQPATQVWERHWKITAKTNQALIHYPLSTSFCIYIYQRHCPKTVWYMHQIVRSQHHYKIWWVDNWSENHSRENVKWLEYHWLLWLGVAVLRVGRHFLIWFLASFSHQRFVPISHKDNLTVRS